MLLDAVHEIRENDPGIGAYKLWIMLIALYGKEQVCGRDSFYTLLRQHRLRSSLKVPWNNPILAKDSTYPIQEEWNISNAM